MNIVYVVAKFHPYKGGSEMYIQQLAMRAAEDGHNVTILTTDASPTDKKLKPSGEFEGMKLIRTKRFNSHLTLGFYPGMLVHLLKLDADIVHTGNGAGYLWQNFCIFCKKLASRKTKFITSPHDPFLVTLDSAEGAKKIIGTIGKIVLFPYLKIVWPWMWDIVTQDTYKQTKWLTRDYNVSQDKIRTVAIGLERSAIESTKPPQEPPIGITYVGRISWYKGIHKVLYALKELEHEDVNFEFIVMGKVYDEEILDLAEELKLDNVRFVINPTDKERDRILLEESEINILPSMQEATGIALLEGMAKGNAIITTYSNEAADILIEPGINGYIYEFDNTLDLADILKTLGEDEGLRQNMIKLNMAKVHQFTWETIYPEYKQVLTELNNGPRTTND